MVAKTPSSRKTLAILIVRKDHLHRPSAPCRRASAFVRSGQHAADCDAYAARVEAARPDLALPPPLTIRGSMNALEAHTRALAGAQERAARQVPRLAIELVATVAEMTQALTCFRQQIDTNPLLRGLPRQTRAELYESISRRQSVLDAAT